jgi:hypothetical protein
LPHQRADFIVHGPSSSLDAGELRRVAKDPCNPKHCRCVQTTVIIERSHSFANALETLAALSLGYWLGREWPHWQASMVKLLSALGLWY